MVGGPPDRGRAAQRRGRAALAGRVAVGRYVAVAGWEQVVEADALIEAFAVAAAELVDLGGAVVGGVDVDAEGAPALGEVDDADDLACDVGRVGVGGRELGELGRDLVHQPGVVGLVGVGDRGVLHSRHRAIEFKKFLQTIDREVPAELSVHRVLDNSSTHETPAIGSGCSLTPGSSCTSPRPRAHG